jgi:hypothetical protein
MKKIVLRFFLAQKRKHSRVHLKYFCIFLFLYTLIQLQLIGVFHVNKVVIVAVQKEINFKKTISINRPA